MIFRRDGKKGTNYFIIEMVSTDIRFGIKRKAFSKNENEKIIRKAYHPQL